MSWIPLVCVGCCTENSANAQYELGMGYKNDLKNCKSSDQEKIDKYALCAIKCLKNAADQNHTEACYELAELCLSLTNDCFKKHLSNDDRYGPYGDLETGLNIEKLWKNAVCLSEQAVQDFCIKHIKYEPYSGNVDDVITPDEYDIPMNSYQKNMNVSREMVKKFSLKYLEKIETTNDKACKFRIFIGKYWRNEFKT